MTATAAGATPRRAEIIAVGSELLVPPRLDTNSVTVTERLNALGIEVRAKVIVGDRREDLERALRHALDRADLVVLTGGLGPTDDDLTRDAVAAVLDRPLREDASVLARIRQRFASRGARMPEVNRRQALVPDGAEVIENPLGTAPGLWLEHGNRLVLLLPGPPSELAPMIDRVAAERLAPRVGGDRLFRRTVRICGRTESDVEEATFPVYGSWVAEHPPVNTTVLTGPAQVELHLSVRSASAAEATTRLDAALAQLRGVLGHDVFSDDGRSLEEVVGDLLRARAATVGVAESCTGGLISSRLTDVPGSSDYVRLNVVSYSNEAKTRWLGVADDLLRQHGAVSEPVALAMAAGVRRLAGTTYGVGVTGIAGPSGGTPEKPVGTVAIAIMSDEARVVRTFRFPFTRVRVKQFAAQMALDLLRRTLVGAEPGRAFVVQPAGDRGPSR